jgi:hypothetical protein
MIQNRLEQRKNEKFSDVIRKNLNIQSEKIIEIHHNSSKAIQFYFEENN